MYNVHVSLAMPRNFGHLVIKLRFESSEVCRACIQYLEDSNLIINTINANNNLGVEDRFTENQQYCFLLLFTRCSLYDQIEHYMY